MGENSLIQKPKRQKLNEEQGIDGNSKCFGNLPEVLLQHVLSFLPIEDAVRTSVLCKRWELLWTSMPFMYFENHLPAKRTIFMNFVERVLCLHSSDILGFGLNYDVQCDAFRLKSWITAAVRRNVEALCFSLSDLRGQFSLPLCVFTCETLKHLFLYIPCILKLPRIICFSNLETLHIKRVIFSDEYTTQQLFSGLPLLRELELENCRWGCLKLLSISAPKLCYLTINEADMQNPSDCDCDGCQIMIFGANLKFFSYTGEFFNEYLLRNSFSLEVAEIGDTGGSATDEKERQLAYRMFKLLIGLPNVKYLRLFGFAVPDLAYAAELLPNIPIFNKMVYLEFGPVNLDCPALFKILQNSPCLETLNFFKEIDMFFDWEIDDIIWDTVPPYFLSHLKCIKFGCYDGNKDLSAVRMLLKIAVILDKIVITFKESVVENLEMQEFFYKQLIELPKRSQNCKIVLESPEKSH